MSKRIPTVAERVRKALRIALRRDPLSRRGQKLNAIRAATRYSFPTADIEEMLSQIESGYLGKQRL
jgi:CYTH domain-containing protein